MQWCDLHQHSICQLYISLFAVTIQSIVLPKSSDCYECFSVSQYSSSFRHIYNKNELVDACSTDTLNYSYKPSESIPMKPEAGRYQYTTKWSTNSSGISQVNCTEYVWEIAQYILDFHDTTKHACGLTTNYNFNNAYLTLMTHSNGLL